MIITAFHDPEFDLVWVSYRREPFAPGDLIAIYQGTIVTVCMRVGGDAVFTMDYRQIGDKNGLGFVSAAECVTYLNDEFIKRRPLGYQFHQTIPVKVWTINHNMAFYPNVMVIDSAGDPVLTDTRYPAPSIVELKFSSPTAGIAYLS